MYSFLKDKRVLITGASGFLGGELAKEISGWGAKIFYTARSVDMRRPLYGSMRANDWPLFVESEKIIHCDIKDRDDVLHAVAVAEPDFVFHLAALTQVTEARVQPYNAMMTNAVGTLNLLEACRIVKPGWAKIIVSTSDKVYGEGPDEFGETDALNPHHPYDASKACADIVARSYGTYFNESVSVVRFSNIYGPGDANWKRLIPGLLRWGVLGERPLIRSNGKQVRQYLFIDDAIDGLLRLAQAMATGHVLRITEPFDRFVLNMAPKKGHNVINVIHAAYHALKSRGIEMREPVIMGEASDESDVLKVDSFDALHYLAWSARTSLGVGLMKTLDWVRSVINVEQELK